MDLGGQWRGPNGPKAPGPGPDQRAQAPGVPSSGTREISGLGVRYLPRGPMARDGPTGRSGRAPGPGPHTHSVHREG